MDLVEQYLISLKADGRTPASIAWHRAAPARFTTWLTRTEIAVNPSAWTPLVRRQYIVDQTEQPSRTGAPLAASSVNSMTLSLKAFCRWLHREDLIDRDLFAKARIPKAPSLVMPVFSSTELGSILGAVREGSRNMLRDEAVITFMVHTAARASEVRDLDLGNLSFEQGLGNLFGKGHKGRILPFRTVSSRVLLRNVPKHRGHNPGPLLVCDRGDRLTRSGLLKLRTLIGERAGVDLHPRHLRHTFALNYLRARGNVLALQRLLGIRSSVSPPATSPSRPMT